MPQKDCNYECDCDNGDDRDTRRAAASALDHYGSVGHVCHVWHLLGRLYPLPEFATMLTSLANKRAAFKLLERPSDDPKSTVRSRRRAPSHDPASTCTCVGAARGNPNCHAFQSCDRSRKQRALREQLWRRQGMKSIAGSSP